MLRSILIIKLSSVGDVVMTTPLVHHLKSVTGAGVTWAVDEGIAPLLALFAASDPAQTSPWPPGRAQLLVPPGCSHCRRRRCARGCMQRLTPDVVISKAAALLAR